jgi:pilus assembly protein Flp/PilA
MANLGDQSQYGIQQYRDQRIGQSTTLHFGPRRSVFVDKDAEPPETRNMTARFVRQPARSVRSNRCEHQYRESVFVLLQQISVNVSGVTALEYAFIAGLIAIAVITAVASLGTNISNVFSSTLTGL